MPRPAVLVADDDLTFCKLIQNAIINAGYRVFIANNLNQCMSILQEWEIHIVFLDLFFPSVIDGFDALEYTHENYPSAYVTMISSAGSVSDVVRALKCGARDFVEKPVSMEQIIAKIQMVEASLELQESNQNLSIKAINMVGKSNCMQEVYNRIINAARYSTPVLITGETGVGKELVAKALHRLSKNSDKDLITVNCGAIPNELIESELFGYEKGAFTHALSSHKGYFEYADGSSIYLNELGELPYTVQPKLLRVLSEGEVQKIGGKIINVRTRVICDTNRDLQVCIDQGLFRRDLFYRVSTIMINVPPLRERLEDIPMLCSHFINNFCTENNEQIKPLSTEARIWLMQQSWPGNVRELKNTIERGLIVSRGNSITVADLHPGTVKRPPLSPPSDKTNLREALRSFEMNFIISVLEQNNWNITHAAKSMGIDKSNLIRKIRQYNISRDME